MTARDAATQRFTNVIIRFGRYFRVTDSVATL